MTGAASDLPSKTEVVILGDGPVGLALALELARRGVDVVALGRGAGAGGEASASVAASGLLNPQARVGSHPEPLRDLLLFSRHLFSDWVAGLEEDSGLSCEYDLRGGLLAAASDAEEVQLDRDLDWQRGRGLAFEVLGGEEARLREPSLAPSLHAVFAFPREGVIAPERLALSLELSARSAGARLVAGMRIERVRPRAGAVVVETVDGPLPADAVVCVSDVGSVSCAGEPVVSLKETSVDVAVLEAREDPDRLLRFVSTMGVDIVPRRDGRLLAFAPAPPRSGHGRHPRAAELARLLERVWRVVPAAAAYPVLGTGRQTRLASPDGLPLVGETSVAGVYLVAGLGGDAILLAPGVAVFLAELLTGQSPPFPAAPFAPGRFGA